MNSPFLDWVLPLYVEKPNEDDDDDIGYAIFDSMGGELFDGLAQDTAEKFVDAINGYIPLVIATKRALGQLQELPDEISCVTVKPIEKALVSLGALPNKGRWTRRAVLGDVVEIDGMQWVVEDACIGRPEALAGIQESLHTNPASMEPGWRVSLRKLDDGKHNPTGEAYLLWQTGPGTERLLVVGKMQRLFVRTTG